MELRMYGKLSGKAKRHDPGSVKQTGFPSPATHYQEPGIDLNQELISNTDATFFVRVDGNALIAENIYDRDVLIIDRSLTPKDGDIALVVIDGVFKIRRITKALALESFDLWGKITYIIHKAQ